MSRTLGQLISETGNYQLQAMGELEECRSIAVEMQRYRASYRLLKQISQESSNEEYRDQASGPEPVRVIGRPSCPHVHHSRPRPGACGLGTDRHPAGGDPG